jgi:hypothetical protein
MDMGELIAEQFVIDFDRLPFSSEEAATAETSSIKLVRSARERWKSSVAWRFSTNTVQPGKN